MKFNLDNVRFWVIRNMAPVVFLGAYFFTVVLGNLVYLTPSGHAYLQTTSSYLAIYNFSTLFSFGYWILLFLPFLVTPLIVMLVRFKMEHDVNNFVNLIPDFSKVVFTVIVSCCFLIVVYSLLKADAINLFTSGFDAISSVEARFKILSQTGFFSLVVLMSILPYLSLYSLIKWFHSKQFFWSIATILMLILMTICLVLLNMKWPILIFYLALVIAVFVYSQRRPFLKALMGAVLLVMMYLLISVFVFRIVSNNEHKFATGERKFATKNIFKSATQNAPMLLMAAINRMAIIYPYYYHVFTTEGSVCGGVLKQAQRGPACRPSTFIYSRIFVDDGFNGRGTSPAAVHISGYALGGWPLAILALVCASVILGLFTCIPLNASAALGALRVTGAIVGYHFSQLPGEGPLIYDHGVLWLFFALLLYKGYLWIRTRLSPIKSVSNNLVEP